MERMVVVFAVVLVPLMIYDYDFFNFVMYFIFFRFFFVFSMCNLSSSHLLTLTSRVRLRYMVARG